ncbi:serine hydrolase domain-containing protein [Alteribacillus sp. HJP-4]|uniref:serine hydrolase domain-containing protein n=1 Tax=Alteribacillus sp. HJP-4 TaxID=2775394 RepID=UPI0035CD0CDD
MKNKTSKIDAAQLNNIILRENFSGVIHVKEINNTIFQKANGYADRVEERENIASTGFGIASGCKIFTATAICLLAEDGLLTFDTLLKDCLDIPFPYFDERITIHHLLCHSSGMPDYFNEEIMDDYEELWKEVPMYLLTNPSAFLPLFQTGKMMFPPGEKFHYNNAGYIVLGLIVEKLTGVSLHDYVELNIFERCGMVDSGYFSMDHLPKNTDIGYIDKEDGTWKTNIYSIPIKGGADGGAFVTTSDMIKFWDALIHQQLLSKFYTELLLTPHIQVEEELHYGYGVWINKFKGNIQKYYVIGFDPGVRFYSAYYPKSKRKLVISSNKNDDLRLMRNAVEKSIPL